MTAPALLCALALLISAGPPGPSEADARELATAALGNARTALRKAGLDAAKADAELASARGLFERGEYAQAAKAADEVWQARSQKHEGSAFAVSVDEKGSTEVRHLRGRPVQVESNGEAKTVGGGEKLTVVKGEPEAPVAAVAPPLLAPVPLSPTNAEQLELLGDAKALGPVWLRWKQVKGAQGYEVELAGAAGEPRRLVVKVARASFGKLPEGTYRWRVHALSEQGRASSPEQQFQLKRRELKLKVTGGTTFK